VVLCIGETLEQRQAGQTDSVNLAQLYYGLAGVDPEQVARVKRSYTGQALGRVLNGRG